MRKRIRLSKASISDVEKASVMQALEAENLGMGAHVEMLEKKIRSYLKTDMEVVCVSSGTSALHVALAGAGVTADHEVLVPSITYVGSFQAVSATGATPVPCEVQPDTLFIDAEDAKKRISEKTRAIMPVHYASSSKGMDQVYKLASDHGLRVIEDAAQAFGCKRDGRVVGTEGDVVCFSFDGIKNITCGEGGAILARDQGLIERCKDSRLLGVQKDTVKRYSGKRSWDFDVSEQGWRYHMSNIMASIGIAQLDRIDSFRRSRLKIVHNYISNLERITQVTPLKLEYDELIPHIFVVKAASRDGLREYLDSNGIETGLHYKPNHLLSKYASNERLPIAEQCYNEILTLPCHHDLSVEEQAYVLQKIEEFYCRSETDSSLTPR